MVAHMSEQISDSDISQPQARISPLRGCEVVDRTGVKILITIQDMLFKIFIYLLTFCIYTYPLGGKLRYIIEQ